MAMIGTGHTFASYFAFAVDSICKVLWREGVARGPQELVRRTGNRIRRLERRFNALVARWRAGTLPAVVGGQGAGVSEKVTPQPGPLLRSLDREEPPPRPSPASAGEGANGAGGAKAA